MTTTWILVANASIARLFAHSGHEHGLALVKELSHPQSRMKNADLVTDRAGHMQGSGDGHGSRQPRTEAKEQEALHFAGELALELGHGRNAGKFEHIVLVATPGFLGMLNDKLDPQLAKLVTRRYEKDYTQITDKELAAHLEL